VAGVAALSAYVVAQLGGLVELNLKAARVSQGPFHEWLAMPWGPLDAPLVSPLFNFTLFGLTVTLGLAVAPHVVNNALAASSERHAKWGPLACYLLGLAAIMSASLLGLAARVAEADGLIQLEPHPLGGKWYDMALPTLAEAVLPEALFSLFLVVVLAAVMSTTDRLVLTIGVNVGYDLYRGLLRPEASERSVQAVSKLAVAAAGVATYLAALSPPPLLAWLVWLTLGLICNTWLAPLLCGLYWRKATREGCVASMAAGLAVTAAAGYLCGPPPIGLGVTPRLLGMPFYFALPGLLASWAAMVVVSLATSRATQR